MRRANIAKVNENQAKIVDPNATRNAGPGLRVGDAMPANAVDPESVEAVIALGAEHTWWRTDKLSPSGRAKRLLEKAKKFIITVLTFWDHRITRLSIEGRELYIDQSGSYNVV